MKYRGKNLHSYPNIIDYALSLKGKAQADFVKAYAAAGPYALANMGYISGYYGPRKMAQIQRVFKTAHPDLRTHPTDGRKRSPREGN